jgi:uncharacterized protein Veg
MSSVLTSLDEVKQKVLELKGRKIRMEVNKGRNRIVKLNGVIDQVYPSMFVIKPTDKVDLDRMSFSYNDVLCGDINFL